LGIFLFGVSSTFTSGYTSIPEKFVVSNCDFSNYVFSNRPANWSYTAGGTYTFEPSAVAGQNEPIAFVIQGTTTGPAWYQDVDFLDGQYQLSVEAMASGSDVGEISVGGYHCTVSSSTWQSYNLDFNASGLTRVSLSLKNAGTVKFRTLRVKINNLTSSVIPCMEGETIGSIIVDSNSETERYAAYELQRYLKKMTGVTAGISGRDTAYSGHSIIIGSAVNQVFSGSLEGLADDSYLVGSSGEGDILLVGNTPRGTLYAVYDFLKIQGCGWYMPGAIGEVVPSRSGINTISSTRIETPSYNLRGLLLYAMQFDLNNGWILLNVEEYFDWAVRNRINGILLEYDKTADFGSFRGGQFSQLTNHAWHKFMLDTQPNWWPLVDGVRTKLYIDGRYNELCVSNAEMRNYVTQTTISFFDNNPLFSCYALSADDEPAFWCECQYCRALDSDLGAGLWIKADNGQPALSMTDRALNFVNSVAQSISSAYPDKEIEMYAYASTKEPPVRELVGNNVYIKYCMGDNIPVNKPVIDMNFQANVDAFNQINGWKNADACELGLYDYGNYWHIDSPALTFAHQADYLKTFNSWGIKRCLGETSHNLMTSALWYDLRAQSYWNPDVNYIDVLKQMCERFYGLAGTDMFSYYIFMQQRMLDSKINWNDSDAKAQWRNFADYDVPAMERGRKFLDSAVSHANNDSVLLGRLAYARLAHAIMTIEVGKNSELNTFNRTAITSAFNLARDLMQAYGIRLQSGSPSLLQKLWFVPYGSTWDRSVDWTANSNPDDDSLGNLVWQYTDVDRGDALGGSNPWYVQSTTDMVWSNSYWRSSVSTAPRVYSSYMQAQLGKVRNSVIRWINSTGDVFELKIAGKLQLTWGANCDVSDIDIVVAKRDVGLASTSILFSKRVLKPSAKISYSETVEEALDIAQVKMQPNDELLISMRPVFSAGTGNINLYDDLVLTVVPHSPEFCGDENTVYLSGDISGPAGQADCNVNFWDLAVLAENWLY
jgi:hypothetical protein